MTTAVLAHASAAAADEKWMIRLSTTYDVAYVVAQAHGASREEVEARLDEYREIAVSDLALHNQMVEDYRMGPEWDRTIGHYTLIVQSYNGYDVAETFIHPVTQPAT